MLMLMLMLVEHKWEVHVEEQVVNQFERFLLKELLVLIEPIHFPIQIHRFQHQNLRERKSKRIFFSRKEKRKKKKFKRTNRI